MKKFDPKKINIKTVRKVCLALTVVELLFVIIFWRYMNITEGSIVPLLILTSPLASTFRYYRRQRRDIKYDGNNKEFVPTEPVKSFKTIFLESLDVFITILPLNFPFIFFFPTAVKVGVPISVLLIAFVAILVFVGITMRKDHEEQKKRDDEEMRRQKEREESGNWK